MAKRSFRCFVEQELGQLPLFMIYAVLEWALIIILFVDGFLAFLANEFARFFELRIPCLFCTRIDHVLVRRDANFYFNDSICETHKKDVSSLAYCHFHKKLSDIRNMCDACLLSFATEKESDCGTYKSLVGILHKDIDLIVDNDREIQLTLPSSKGKDEAMSLHKSNIRRCSCCGEALKVKPYPRGKSFGLQVSTAPAPSPRVPPFMSFRSEENHNTELPHIRYTELKLSSDNESEIPDDEDGLKTPSLNGQFREDGQTVTVPLLEPEDMPEDRTPTLARGNRFFGIPLTDSATSSPRWATRLPRKSPLEKMEFGFEAAEGNAAHEADGDSILHHLNRQVRLDRKSLIALYMELDEERSASAVAANNAMAMITRLQAEKAAVQMEALQYQRMMEEQAEYDQEALQATHELLMKRDEEIRVLEAELEAYRTKYGILEEELCSVGSGGEVEKNKQLQESKSSHSSYERSECVSPTYNSAEGHISSENSNNDDELTSSFRGLNELEIVEKRQKAFPRRKSGVLGRLRHLDKKMHLLIDDDEAPSTESSTNDYGNQKTKEIESEFNLTLKLSHICEFVKSLGAHDEIVKQGTEIHKEASERRKLLTEIFENLEKFQHIVKSPFGDDDDA